MTMPLDGEKEAVVALDRLTRELTGYVLDRFIGKVPRHSFGRSFPTN
jgi:hypothetical protein